MTTLIEFANNYMATKIDSSAWSSLAVTDKPKYIAEALRQLNSVEGINLPVVDSENDYTDDIKTAICEIAYEILANPNSSSYEKLKRAGVTSVSYGNDSISFNPSFDTSKTGNCLVNDYAYSQIRKYIQRSYNIV